MKGRTIIDVIATALIILFLYATFMQVVFHNTYYLQLNHSLANKPAAIIIIWLLPVMHLLLCYLLWRPATRLAGLCFSLAAVSLFTVYLFFMLPSGNRSRCLCGEIWQKANLEFNILFNMAIILLSSVAIIVAGRFKNNSPNFS